jgi:hypothetical protein
MIKVDIHTTLQRLEKKDKYVGDVCNRPKVSNITIVLVKKSIKPTRQIEKND